MELPSLSVKNWDSQFTVIGSSLLLNSCNSDTLDKYWAANNHVPCTPTSASHQAGHVHDKLDITKEPLPLAGITQ